MYHIKIIKGQKVEKLFEFKFYSHNDSTRLYMDLTPICAINEANWITSVFGFKEKKLNPHLYLDKIIIIKLIMKVNLATL